MKKFIIAILLCDLLAFATRASAAILPASCGNSNVKFNVKTEKGAHLPTTPETGKAQIVFIERENQMIGPFMRATVRYGMDGAWVGADNGNSYFALTVDPGLRHLCANWQSDLKRFGKNADAISFTAEPGQVYYVAADVTVESKDVVNFGFSKLDADEGEYLIKTFDLSTSKPK